MPGFILHVGAAAICPHGGQVSILTNNGRVFVSGQPAATQTDTFTVTGCAFTVPPGKPQPCVVVRYLEPSTRVSVGGKPVVLQNSTALCQSAEQAPQGAPTVIASQVRVRGV
jgi:uncharacterized Zn-binding protein involved in type VI secretion